MIYGNYFLEKASSNTPKTLYFLSDKNMDGKTLSPRVPNNFFTKNGYEDGTTPRVSLSGSIHGCLMGISNNLQDKEFYVHKVVNNPKIKKPTISEVPDSKVTKEIWGLSPVKLKCVGLIQVTSAIDTPKKFTYGDNEAELYDWNYKYLKMFK